MIEIVKNTASVIGCVLSCITLGGLIIKPIRNSIAKWIKEAVTSANDLKEIKDSIDELGNRMNELNNKIDHVDDRVFENERDRLRMELSNCAARCRRGVPLHIEEYNTVQDAYRKYSEELHCNGIGHDTWVYINSYYNSQDFNNMD